MPRMPGERVAAIGKFDALHRGHRALVAAAAVHGAPVLIGFAGMARELGWEPRLPLVAPVDRPRVLADWGDDLRPIEEVPLPFVEVRHLRPSGFLDLLARRFGIRGVITGADFRFGRDRSGDIMTMARLCTQRGWWCATVPPVRHRGVPVSSTGVRQALAAGRVDEVRSLLGRPHRLCAEVVRGDGRGAGIGFPTANCGALGNQPPGPGVYACRAWVAGAGPYAAAVNVGHLPTVGDHRPLSIEAHLLEYAGECYGADIALDFLIRIRDECRFPDLDALLARIRRDVAATRAAVGGGASVRPSGAVPR